MKPVKLSELIESLEFDFEEIGAFVDLENGCVVMVERSVLSDVEEGDEEGLSDIPDWQKDEVEIARAIVADSGKRFVAPPDKYEFHEYQKMERFISTVRKRWGCRPTLASDSGQGRVPPFQRYG